MKLCLFKRRYCDESICYFSNTIFLIMLMLFPICYNALQAQDSLEEIDELDHGYITMKNRENGKIIMRTAELLTPAMKTISAENDLTG